MNDDSTSRLHAFIEGHVQGVGFRMYTLQAAQRFNLTGWVRNTWNDEVEILAEGPRVSLDTFLALVRQGPRGSYVINVRSDWENASGEFANFDVYPTA